jgi:hypothetical protein
LHFDQLLGEFSSPARKNQSTKLTWLTSKKLAAAGFARRFMDPLVQTPLGDSEWEVSNE